MSHASFQNGAYLQESASGRVYLRVHDLVYGADDALPASLYPAELPPRTSNARYFVNTCMIIEYGRDEARWPALARRFVRGG
ncbi:MAG TPA: hypothetical protein VHA15_03280 [Burkholderiales bacterium]|jgi:hypothetical protein|nr:hypothetical protein [Burkholderiales bacterium]